VLILIALGSAIGSPPAPVVEFIGKFAGNCIVVVVATLWNIFLGCHVAAGFLRTHFCHFALDFVDFHCCRIVVNELSRRFTQCGGTGNLQ